MIHAVLALHLLAAALWVGGTVALVFVAVPAVRTLEGESRAVALRTLARRWRPIGWSSLLVLVGTGIVLAAHEGAFHADVLFGSAFGAVLIAKSVLALGLFTAAALHDFVYGPRLARQIRARQPQRARPALVRVGWASFSLSVLVPTLGVLLAELPVH